MFDLITYLTNKTLAFKIKIDNHLPRVGKVIALVKQYDDLLRYLKENGALLNTIRPEFLVNFQDYQLYCKS